MSATAGARFLARESAELARRPEREPEVFSLWETARMSEDTRQYLERLVREKAA